MTDLALHEAVAGGAGAEFLSHVTNIYQWLNSTGLHAMCISYVAQREVG